MDALLIEPALSRMMETKWSKMLILSLVFHAGIFFLILFVPGSIPSRSIKAVIYEVNLVEMPLDKPSRVTTKPAASKKEIPAKRISKPAEKAKPPVIAKRVVEVERKKEKKPTVASSKLIEQAISKIEEKVEVEKKDHVSQAIARLETQQKAMPVDKPDDIQVEDGIIMRLYQVEIANWIKSNWSYPVALEGPGSKKDLEALVVLSVKNDGKILNSLFKKRSSNPIFDQSVLRAVERSDPLPPFPEGYRKSYDEIEINFNLRELEGY